MSKHTLFKLDLVAHSYNPNTHQLHQEDYTFEAILG